MDSEGAVGNCSRGNLVRYGSLPFFGYIRLPFHRYARLWYLYYELGIFSDTIEKPKAAVCPKCGNHDSAKVSVTRRVCGYLGSPDARPFNAGKQEEVKRRVKHL